MEFEETTQSSRSRGGSFRIVLLATLVGLLLALVCAGCAAQPSGGDANTPTATVEQFSDALAAMDVDAALECCDNQANSLYESANGIASGMLSDMGVEINPETIIRMLSPSMSDILASPIGSNTTVTIKASDLRESITGDNAIVTGNWTMTIDSDGKERTQTAPCEFKLVRENGRWKISFADQIAQGVDALRHN